jgi:hypothetical protein
MNRDIFKDESVKNKQSEIIPQPFLHVQSLKNGCCCQN